MKSIWALVMIVITGGCQSPWPSGRHTSSLTDSSPRGQTSRQVASADRSTTTDAANPAPASNASSAKTQEEAMAEVLGELQQIGAIDHAAQQQLMADLRQAKPENWPLIVKQFQSALAYRQQLAAKESHSLANQKLAEQKKPSNIAQVSTTVPVSLDAHKKAVAQTPSADTSETPSPRAIPKTAPAVARREQPLKKTEPRETDPQSTQPLPLPKQPDSRTTTAIAAPAHSAVKQASHTPLVASNTSWQEHLRAAITELEQTTKSAPSTIEDVHQHMRLRLLHLLAGQEDDALRPIPGASSTLQDYWSKQLFAISTYLDNARQPDDKRRAAGSLVHLDQARANLAELATLQARNLTFVKSVDGFGVYQAVEEAKFHPGDQVTLYTEVENFRSEATKEGYRTALGTSYEVLDQNGRRVDGAQFPDVEDVCKNHRRDFHMQYGIALPTRIYAGEYQLRLTITDQLSHKIGQISVPFEIVE